MSEIKIRTINGYHLRDVETNNQLNNFIQETESNLNIKADVITEEKSDSFITITNAAATPAVSLISHIEPIQSGSGEASPDNVRPISGWDSVTAKRTGKNLLQNYDVTVTSSQAYAQTYRDYILPAGVYTLRAWVIQGGTVTTASISVRPLNNVLQILAEKDLKSQQGDIVATFSAPDDGQGIRVYYYSNKTGTAMDTACTFANIIVESGREYTGYEPYSGQTLSTDLPETVYSGTLDWTTGVLLTDGLLIDADTLNWSYWYGNMFYAPTNIYINDVLCDIYPPGSLTAYGVFLREEARGTIYIRDTSLTDGAAGAAELKQKLSGHKIYYKKESPVEYQLTPQQLTMLKGLNNVWSNTGNTDIVYAIDQDMIHARIIELENKVDKLNNLVIENEVSGSLITITDGGKDMEARSLVSHIELAQEGEGDPSPDNVRPISGWDAVNVTGAGKNLFGGDAFKTALVNAGGVYDSDANKTTITAASISNVIFFTNFKPNTQYTIIFAGQNTNANYNLGNAGVFYTDGTVDYLNFPTKGEKGTTVFVSNPSKSIRSFGGVRAGGSSAFYTDECGIFEGVLTADDYVSYNGETLTAELPETVYGGSLDWNTGVLTVDRKIVDMGTVSWTYQAASKLFFTSGILSADDSYPKDQMVCSAYTVSTVQYAEMMPDLSVWARNDALGPRNVILRNLAYTDATALKNALAGVTLVFKTASPTTIQLTPQQLTMLKGLNNIWSNSGNTDIVYAIDPDAIHARIIELENEVDKLNGLVIENEVSDPLITITDGGKDMETRSLVSHIELVQEGEGDPSPDNVRPISGWDAVNVTGTGKNLFGGKVLAEAIKALSPSTIPIDENAGTVTFHAGNAGSKNLFNVKNNASRYTLVLKGKNANYTGTNITFYYTDGTYSSINFESVDTVSTIVAYSSPEKQVRSVGTILYGGSTVLYYNECGLFEGILTKEDFAAYKDQTLTADLPETVYGGMLNWTTGVLTVTHHKIVFDGVTTGAKLDMTDPGVWTYAYIFAINMPKALKFNTTACANKLKSVGTNTVISLGLPVELTGVTSADDTATVTAKYNAVLKQWYDAGTPLEVVYEMATPEEIQLTPQQLTTLKGTNNVWSDTGDTSLVYVADTKLYTDEIKKIAEASLNTESWAGIQKIIQAGLGPKLFPVGTQLTVNHSMYGPQLFDVVAHDYLKSVHDENAHTMTIMQHDLFSGIQFDAAEAFYYADAALAAGTYNFTLAEAYSSWAAGTYQFALTQTLPKGGQLTIGGSAGAAMTTRQVRAYANQMTTTATESVAITSGSGGTSLGTFGVELNHVQRVTNGSNNYKESAMRQFLNSSAPAGSVWSPQTKFDRPPSWLTSIAGYKAGLDPDFLAVVGQVVLPCAANNTYEAPDSTVTKGAKYTLNDEFYLASTREIFNRNLDVDDDSVVFHYYEGAGNADRIKYRNGSAAPWWLRTPLAGTSGYVRVILTSGEMNNDRLTTNAYGLAPACTIV